MNISFVQKSVEMHGLKKRNDSVEYFKNQKTMTTSLHELGQKLSLKYGFNYDDILSENLIIYSDIEAKWFLQYFQQLFGRFLKEKGCYREYIKENHLATDQGGINWSVFPTMPIAFYVSSAFPWSDSTSHDGDYWWDLDEEWNDIIEELDLNQPINF